MKKKSHYIDNKKFLEEMTIWKEKYNKAKENDEPIPRLSEYIGECFLLIATNLAQKSNFMHYPYKEEMISDGIENCIMYCYNFDPVKYKNPFSYFTQIIYYAFLRRIQKEKKQTYIKYELIRNEDKDGKFCNFLSNDYIKKTDDIVDTEEVLEKHLDLTPTDIDKFSKKNKKKLESKQRSSTGSTLDAFLE